MNGKGSAPRPSSVSRSTLDANWERTFSRPATRVCDRCGERNPADIHTCTPPECTTCDTA